MTAPRPQAPPLAAAPRQAAPWALWAPCLPRLEERQAGVLRSAPRPHSAARAPWTPLLLVLLRRRQARLPPARPRAAVRLRREQPQLPLPERPQQAARARAQRHPPTPRLAPLPRPPLLSLPTFLAQPRRAAGRRRQRAPARAAAWAPSCQRGGRRRTLGAWRPRRRRRSGWRAPPGPLRPRASKCARTRHLLQHAACCKWQNIPHEEGAAVHSRGLQDAPATAPPGGGAPDATPPSAARGVISDAGGGPGASGAAPGTAAGAAAPGGTADATAGSAAAGIALSSTPRLRHELVQGPLQGTNRMASSPAAPEAGGGGGGGAVPVPAVAAAAAPPTTAAVATVAAAGAAAPTMLLGRPPRATTLRVSKNEGEVGVPAQATRPWERDALVCHNHAGVLFSGTGVGAPRALPSRSH